jgi:hypothetical protein
VQNVENTLKMATIGRTIAKDATNAAKQGKDFIPGSKTAKCALNADKKDMINTRWLMDYVAFADMELIKTSLMVGSIKL